MGAPAGNCEAIVELRRVGVVGEPRELGELGELRGLGLRSWGEETEWLRELHKTIVAMRDIHMDAFVPFSRRRLSTYLWVIPQFASPQSTLVQKVPVSGQGVAWWEVIFEVRFARS